MTLRLAHIGVCSRSGPDAAHQLSEAVEIDYLVDEPLTPGELGELALVKRAERRLGYRTEFLESLSATYPGLFLQPGLRLLTSAGAANPRACAAEAARVLVEHQLEELPIAVVQDDLLDRLEELIQSGCSLENKKSGKSFVDVADEAIQAQVWLGARGLASALGQNARLVIGGAVTTSSLAVAASIHEYGWEWSDFDRLASAAVVGHCLGAGPILTWGWGDSARPTLPPFQPGYPVAELAQDGSAVLSKSPHSDGQMSAQTVRTWLENSTSTNTPDVRIDARELKITASDPQQQLLTLSGIRGAAPDHRCRATISLLTGYEANVIIPCRGKRQRDLLDGIVEVVQRRLEASGHPPETIEIVPFVDGAVRLRAFDPGEEPIARFARQMAHWHELCPPNSPLQPNTTQVKPFLSEWPTTVPHELAEPTVDCRPARDWV